MKSIDVIENNFKSISGIDLNLKTFPIKKSDKKHQVDTDTDKSKKFGEVFTPIWLVDYMIGMAKIKKNDIKTLDLCAGYGQFSIRLLRYYKNKFKNIDNFFTNHYFSELQISSCFKLMTIFGSDINLFIGDSLYLNKVPQNAKGIWVYLKEFNGWISLTKTIRNVFRNSVSEEDFVNKVEKITEAYNQEYLKMNNELSQIVKSQKGRLQTFKMIQDNLTSWQEYETPQEIISDMVGLVDDIEHKTILVLFNAEIVENLIHSKKLQKENITFACDKEAEITARYIKEIYGVDYILFGQNIKDVEKTFDNVKKTIKFDLCLSNPPYNGGIDLKILQALMNDGGEESVAKEYIIVHPSTWLLDQKNKNNLYINIKNMLSGKLKSVKFFNGNLVFGIGLFVPCVISHIVINNSYPNTKVNLFDEEFTVNDISDITKFGKSWVSIVKPFMNEIEKIIKKDGHVWLHRIKVDNNRISCQLARVRGHVNISSNARHDEMVSDDFYTMLPRNAEEIYGIRKALDQRGGPSFEFNSTIERDNFINYLKSDFARFCFSLLKNKSDVDCGELTTIPWLDFTQSWDDEKLFKHFDINQETQDYIKNFLPDYYGIRKK